MEAYAATLKGHAASRGLAKLPISDYGRIRDSGMPYSTISQGHVRNITTLNRKILTQVITTRSHPLKKPIPYTDTLHSILHTLHTMPLTEFAHINLKPALAPSSLPQSFYTTRYSVLRACSHASHTPFYLCQSISTPTDLYLVGV